jgi:hypothetical protein
MPGTLFTSISQYGIGLPVVNAVAVVGALLHLLLEAAVVGQVPEGGPVRGRLPLQPVDAAVEGAVGQVEVDGGLQGSRLVRPRLLRNTSQNLEDSVSALLITGPAVSKGVSLLTTGWM